MSGDSDSDTVPGPVWDATTTGSDHDMTDRQTRWIRSAALAACASLIVVAVPGVAAAPAGAATKTITITNAGFVPMNLTIATGDTVSFTNAASAAHEVLFKASTGFTCTVTPVVVQPTQTQSCTWTVAGTYTYSDPNQRDRAFRGTVTVDAPTPTVVPTVSLAAAAAVVRYGAETTLSGKVMPTDKVATVDILAMSEGESTYTKVASAATTNGGAFSVAVTPEIRTSYRAEYQDGATRIVSPVTTVSVRPAVGLVLRDVRNGRAHFVTRVTSGMTYEGRYVLVQRKNSSGGWTTLKRATLGTYSKARFVVRVGAGTSRIRTLLTTTQAGTGYLSSASRTVLATR